METEENVRKEQKLNVYPGGGYLEKNGKIFKKREGKTDKNYWDNGNIREIVANETQGDQSSWNTHLRIKRHHGGNTIEFKKIRKNQ
jgi:hypothetical protein